MTIFTQPWTVSYEAIPQDSEDANLGALRIRELKVSVRERLVVDHEHAGNADDGKHVKVTFKSRANTYVPPRETGESVIFSRISGAVVGDRMELFFKDSEGADTQLTKKGVINFQAFPAGTRILFPQAVVPAGWVPVTNLHDRVLRVVNTINEGGGVAAGSWEITGLTVAGHALTIDQIPPHDHTPLGGGNFIKTGGGAASAAGAAIGEVATTSLTGGGNTHTHGIAHNAAWRPAYLNVVIGEKS